MLRCPNCGSSAQVKVMCGGAYRCGCGQVFYLENGKAVTAQEICAKYEKANKTNLRTVAEMHKMLQNNF